MLMWQTFLCLRLFSRNVIVCGKKRARQVIALSKHDVKRMQPCSVTTSVRAEHEARTPCSRSRKRLARADEHVCLRCEVAVSTCALTDVAGSRAGLDP